MLAFMCGGGSIQIKNEKLVGDDVTTRSKQEPETIFVVGIV